MKKLKFLNRKLQTNKTRYILLMRLISNKNYN